MAKKKKADSSVGFVEAGMTLIIAVKEGEWKELKQYRDESVLYQIGTSFIAFSASTGIAIYLSDTNNSTKIFIVWALFFLFMGAGITILWFWWKEHNKKKSVVTRVENRVVEKYGEEIDL